MQAQARLQQLRHPTNGAGLIRILPGCLDVGLAHLQRSARPELVRYRGDTLQESLEKAFEEDSVFVALLLFSRVPYICSSLHTALFLSVCLSLSLSLSLDS